MRVEKALKAREGSEVQQLLKEQKALKQRERLVHLMSSVMMNRQQLSVTASLATWLRCVDSMLLCSTIKISELCKYILDFSDSFILLVVVRAREV